MRHRQTYDFKFATGACENGFVVFPLPEGPYILLQQDDKRVADEGTPWKDFFDSVELDKIRSHPDLLWGYVLFGNVDGIAKKVAAHYDSSD